MKIFKLEASLEFNAEDLENAFRLLSTHFHDLAINGESTLDILGGSIELSPLCQKIKETK